MVACWSYVEFQLRVVIREALNISMTAGLILMTDLRIHPLCEAARAAAQDPSCCGDEHMRAEIVALANDINGKAQLRHDFAHGVFGFVIKEDSSQLYRFVTKKPSQRVTPQWEPVSLSMLKEMADEAYNLGVRAQDLTVKLKSWKRSAVRVRPR